MRTLIGLELPSRTWRAACTIRVIAPHTIQADRVRSSMTRWRRTVVLQLYVRLNGGVVNGVPVADNIWVHHSTNRGVGGRYCKRGSQVDLQHTLQLARNDVTADRCAHEANRRRLMMQKARFDPCKQQGVVHVGVTWVVHQLVEPGVAGAEAAVQPRRARAYAVWLRAQLVLLDGITHSILEDPARLLARSRRLAQGTTVPVIIVHIRQVKGHSVRKCSNTTGW
jgi:hypothetical protein